MEQKPRRNEGPVERVDPFDFGDVEDPAEEARHATTASERLDVLRAQIEELDRQVAGLLDRREELTRAAFALVGATPPLRRGEAV